MKAKHFFLIVASCIALCSCSSVKHTSTTANVDMRVYSFSVADVNVQPEKVSATTSWSFNPFKRVDVELIKLNTTAKLIQDAEADILVEPQYIVYKGGFMRGGYVTVYGFPATYSNFHNMTPEEAEIVKAINSADCNKKPKPRKRFFFF